MQGLGLGFGAKGLGFSIEGLGFIACEKVALQTLLLGSLLRLMNI